MSKTPYLIQQTPIAPGVTGSRVLFIVQCFRCSPLDWDLASMSNIVVLISQITRHTKVRHLHVPCSGIKVNRIIKAQKKTCSYLAYFVLRHENIPSSQIPMYKPLPSKILHTMSNLLRENEKKLWKISRRQLSRTVIRTKV